MNKKTSPSDLIAFLEHEVYPSLYRYLDSALPEFGFIRKGRYWQATNKDRTKTHFNARPDSVMCYENTPFGFTVQGGEGFTTWLTYIGNNRDLRGKDFIDAVRDWFW